MHFTCIIREDINSVKLAEWYMARIVPLHGVPLRIISDRGSLFVSRFWQNFQTALGTRLNFCIAYHPQTDGQTERVKQVLEDMLRACVIFFGKGWENISPSPSSPTTTVIRLASKWLPLRFFMGENVGLL